MIEGEGKVDRMSGFQIKDGEERGTRKRRKNRERKGQHLYELRLL